MGGCWHCSGWQGENYSISVLIKVMCDLAVASVSNLLMPAIQFVADWIIEEMPLATLLIQGYQPGSKRFLKLSILSPVTAYDVHQFSPLFPSFGARL